MNSSENKQIWVAPELEIVNQKDTLGGTNPSGFEFPPDFSDSTS